MATLALNCVNNKNTQGAVFSEGQRPATSLLQPLAVDEDRVTAEGNETRVSLVGHAAGEPEVILQDIVNLEPLLQTATKVHQLYAALDNVEPRLPEKRFDMEEERLSNIVFSVENPYNVASAEGKCGIKLLSLRRLVIVSDHELETIRIPTDDRSGRRDSKVIVIAQRHYDLTTRMLLHQEPAEGVANDSGLIARWND